MEFSVEVIRKLHIGTASGWLQRFVRPANLKLSCRTTVNVDHRFESGAAAASRAKFSGE
jgi:hypothetical protein